MKTYRSTTASQASAQADLTTQAAWSGQSVSELPAGFSPASETALLDAMELRSLPEALHAALTAVAQGKPIPPEALAKLRASVTKALDSGSVTLLSSQLLGAMNTTPATREGEQALTTAREEAKAANKKAEPYDNRYHRGLQQVWEAFKADSSPSEQTMLALALAGSPELSSCAGGIQLTDFGGFGHNKAAKWAKGVAAAAAQLGDPLWCAYLEGMQAPHLVDKDLWEATPPHLRTDLLERLNRDEVARARLAAAPALVVLVIASVPISDPSYPQLAAVAVTQDAGVLGPAGLARWAPTAQLDALNRLSETARTNLKAVLTPTVVSSSPGLQAWLDGLAASAGLPQLIQLFQTRFDLRVGERNGMAFDEVVLRQLWTTLAALPPGHVAGNTALDELLPDGNDKAYATGGHSESSGAVYLGYGPAHATQTLAKVPNINVGSELKKVNALNHALRHEVGHAVDDGAGVMAANRGLAALGGWETFSSTSTFAQAMVDDGLKGATADQLATALDAGTPQAVQALSREATVSAAAEVLAEGGARWDGEPKSTIGSHVYKQLGGAWWRYDAASRTTKVSDYQFKSPGEWFAEAYAAYYATGTPGEGLKDAAASAWISSNIAPLTSIVDED